MSKLRDKAIERAKVSYTVNQVTTSILEAYNDALEEAAKLAELTCSKLGDQLAKAIREMKEAILT